MTRIEVVTRCVAAFGVFAVGAAAGEVVAASHDRVRVVHRTDPLLPSDSGETVVRKVGSRLVLIQETMTSKGVRCAWFGPVPPGRKPAPWAIQVCRA